MNPALPALSDSLLSLFFTFSSLVTILSPHLRLDFWLFLSV